MTLTELVEKVARATGYDYEEAWALTDEIVKAVIRELGNGEDIKIRGLGTFMWVSHGERKRRHPRTKELVVVPPRQVLRFRPSKFFKEVDRGEVQRGSGQREGEAG